MCFIQNSLTEIVMTCFEFVRGVSVFSMIFSDSAMARPFIPPSFIKMQCSATVSFLHTAKQKPTAEDKDPLCNGFRSCETEGT